MHKHLLPSGANFISEASSLASKKCHHFYTPPFPSGAYTNNKRDGRIISAHIINSIIIAFNNQVFSSSFITGRNASTSVSEYVFASPVTGS